MGLGVLVGPGMGGEGKGGWGRGCPVPKESGRGRL